MATTFGMPGGKQVLVAILLVAAATIGGALVSEHVFGLVPCKLCLMERQPYYVALSLGAVLLLAPPRGAILTAGLAAVGLIFLAGAGLGGYHAGAEWGFWPGPGDCGGGSGAGPADVGDFLQSLNRTRVVSCTEAAWRFAGISLAGWNALISLGLALAAFWAAARARVPQGSSSVSQYR